MPGTDGATGSGAHEAEPSDADRDAVVRAHAVTTPAPSSGGLLLRAPISLAHHDRAEPRTGSDPHDGPLPAPGDQDRAQVDPLAVAEVQGHGARRGHDLEVPLRPHRAAAPVGSERHDLVARARHATLDRGPARAGGRRAGEHGQRVQQPQRHRDLAPVCVR